MITLNGEKELTRIHDWADIQARPDFDGQLDPNAHELEAIIGSYALRDKIPCGLSNCRTLHGRGYLVATKDGRTTNIGKDCGRVYFGVDFETMLSQFTRDIAARNIAKGFGASRFASTKSTPRSRGCAKGGAGAPGAGGCTKTRPLLLLNAGCPAPIVRRVVQLLRTGGDEVMGFAKRLARRSNAKKRCRAAR